jgi:transcriptional regulator with XRE-family HTH domain
MNQIVPKRNAVEPMTEKEFNLEIGQKLRRRRRTLGLTQEQLAAKIGLTTFQQIQKYECAANAMSAVRLWQMAEALEVPPSYFYPRSRFESSLDI